MKSLIVKSQFVSKYLLWLALILAAMGCALSPDQVGWPECIQILLSIGASAYLVSLRTTLEVDAEVIRYSEPASCWEMKWSEVTKIETSHTGINVLHGHNKTLVLPSLSLWQHEGKAQMLEFIQAQAQAWDIPQQRTLRASFQSSRNTRNSLFKKPKPPLST